MASGGSGRNFHPTGTVPKVKSRNDRERLHRDPRRNNMQNNLAVQGGSVRNRPAKESNTSCSPADLTETGQDTCAHETGRVIPSYSDYQRPYFPIMSSHGSPNSSTAPRAENHWRETSVVTNGVRSENTLPDRNTPTSSVAMSDVLGRDTAILKSSNVAKAPDVNQMQTFLNSIRGYLSETNLMMENLRTSNDPSIQNSRSSTPVNQRNSCSQQNRSQSEEMADSMLKFSIASRRNELKVKVEQSQKKLKALQEQQASLYALQRKAEEQLREARAAQFLYLSQMSAPSDVDQQQYSRFGDNLRASIDQINSSLSALQDIRENQVLDDASPPSEQNLPQKQKNHESRDSIPGRRHENSEGGESSSEDEVTGVCSGTEVNSQVADLQAKKAQLARLKALMKGYEASQEHQERKLHAVKEKRDNVTSALDSSHLEVQRKAQRLAEAQAQLKHFQNLLQTIMDYQARGEHVPAHIIAEIAAEAESIDNDSNCGGSTEVNSIPQSENLEREVCESRGRPVREKKTNAQANTHTTQQMLLQVKKKELEELMRKDQDRSSTINQDIKPDTIGNKTDVHPGHTYPVAGDTSCSVCSYCSAQPMSDCTVPGIGAACSNDGTLPSSSHASQTAIVNANAPPPRGGNFHSHIQMLLEQQSQILRDTQLNAPSTNRGNIWLDITSPSQSHDSIPVQLIQNNVDPLLPSNDQIIHQQQWLQMLQQIECIRQYCLALINQVPYPGQTNLRPKESELHQNMLAAFQQQQQQALFNMMNNFCQILWHQQRELANLRTIVQVFQDRLMSPITLHPAEAANQTHSNLDRSLDHLGGSLGVASTHSLPNLGPNPPALNNQVPPGNRANNYWDNFRSYSRQNMLSRSPKTNEEPGNSANVIAEQSSIRIPTASAAVPPAVASTTERASTSRTRSQAEKINKEPTPGTSNPQELTRRDLNLVGGDEKNVNAELLQLFSDLEALSVNPGNESVLCAIRDLVGRQAPPENNLVQSPESSDTDTSAEPSSNQDNATAVATIILPHDSMFPQEKLFKDLRRYLYSHRRRLFTVDLMHEFCNIVIAYVNLFIDGNAFRHGLENNLMKFLGCRVQYISTDVKMVVAETLNKELAQRDIFRDLKGQGSDSDELAEADQPQGSSNLAGEIENEDKGCQVTGDSIDFEETLGACGPHVYTEPDLQRSSGEDNRMPMPMDLISGARYSPCTSFSIHQPEDYFQRHSETSKYKLKRKLESSKLKADGKLLPSDHDENGHENKDEDDVDGCGDRGKKDDKK